MSDFTDLVTLHRYCHISRAVSRLTDQVLLLRGSKPRWLIQSLPGGGVTTRRKEKGPVSRILVGSDELESFKPTDKTETLNRIAAGMKCPTRRRRGQPQATGPTQRLTNRAQRMAQVQYPAWTGVTTPKPHPVRVPGVGRAPEDVPNTQ